MQKDGSQSELLARGILQDTFSLARRTRSGTSSTRRAKRELRRNALPAARLALAAICTADACKQEHASRESLFISPFYHRGCLAAESSLGKSTDGNGDMHKEHYTLRRMPRLHSDSHRHLRIIAKARRSPRKTKCISPPAEERGKRIDSFAIHVHALLILLHVHESWIAYSCSYSCRTQAIRSIERRNAEGDQKDVLCASSQARKECASQRVRVAGRR